VGVKLAEMRDIFRRRRLPKSKTRNGLSIETLESRRVLSAGPLGTNACAPDLDLSGVPMQQVFAGETLTVDLLASGGQVEDLDDQSQPTGDTISFFLDPDVGEDLETPQGAAITRTGIFRWSPTAQQVGMHTLVVLAVDEGSPARGDAETFVVEVVESNQPPTFTIASDPPAVDEDAGAVTVENFATEIESGPAGEPDQNVQFVIDDVSDSSLFSVQPAISAEGELTYTPAADANGTAQVTVLLTDDGGTSGNGDDTSDSQTFTITINPLNDAPQFTIADDPPAVSEDAGEQTVTGFVTDIAAGPATATDEAGQQLTFDVQVTDTTGTLAFDSAPTIDLATGDLSYTPTDGTFGTATVTVTLRDDGASDGNNVNTSAAETFTITVVEGENTAPQLAAIDDQQATAGLQLEIPISATDADGDELTFTLTDGPDSATIFGTGEGTAVIRWTPTNNDVSSPVAFEVTVSDDGTPSLVDVETFEVAVGAAFVVDTAADTVDDDLNDGIAADSQGNVSLRAAVMQANADAGADIIVLGPGTFTFDIAGDGENMAVTGDLDIRDDLTIIGAGANQTIIDADQLDRVFHILQGQVELRNLTVTGGEAAVYGGAVNNSAGELTLVDSAVTGSSAELGGGIFNGGTLNVVRSTISGNTATDGGGIFNQDNAVDEPLVEFDTTLGTFDMQLFQTESPMNVANLLNYVLDGDYNDTIFHRAPDDFVVQGGSFTFDSQTIPAPAPGTEGGWQNIPTDPPVNSEAATNGLSNTFGTVSFALSGDPNSATSGFFVNLSDNSGLDAQGFTVFGQINNGISVVEAIENAPEVDREAAWGSFVFADIPTSQGQTVIVERATLKALGNGTTIINSTISGNTAERGGGIFNEGEVATENTTIADNTANTTGGGIFNDGGAVAMHNTIAADNTATTDPDLSGDFTTEGHNLIGDVGAATGFTVDANGDLVGGGSNTVIDPQLGPLADNGGPTLTHLPGPESPAIDTGENADAPATDQRGAERIVDGDSTASAVIDIGSVERPASDAQTDLQVSVVFTQQVQVQQGEQITYFIGAQNNGPAGVFGATIQSLIPAGLQDVTWTSVADAGVNASASGSGDLIDVVDMPPNTGILYTLTATADGGSATITDRKITTLASITPPASVTDTLPGNNARSESTLVVLAASGGTGTFADSGQTLGNEDSSHVALADFDGDGDLDAFVANMGTANQIWLNDGSGNYTDSGQTLGTAASNSVALADLDDDGDVDAFVANEGANRIWLNDGDGNFTDSGQALGSATSRDVALGDLDGDGDVDAFVANDGANRVWLNDGDGNFADSGQSLADRDSYAVSLGDVNNDGNLDALVANEDDGAKLWVNDGSGSLLESSETIGSGSIVDVAFGDVDDDGDLDAVLANYSGGDQVWDNIGSLMFEDTGQSLVDDNSEAVALGDLDGDGDLDMMVADPLGGNRVLLNDGNGNFTDTGQQLGNRFSFSLALGDLDADGDLDAFVANLGQPNAVWLNQDATTPPATAPNATDAVFEEIGANS